MGASRRPIPNECFCCFDTTTREQCGCSPVRCELCGFCANDCNCADKQADDAARNVQDEYDHE